MADEVADNESLLRRIHPVHVNDGRLEWTAFRDQSLSVDRELLRGIETIRAAFPGQSVARLVAGPCRSEGFVVQADPSRENQAHALVVSSPASRGEARRLAVLLRDLAEWPAT